MNFIETYKEGEEGRSFALDTGIDALNIAINGLQKKTSIGVAAAPKAGKTTFADFCFLLSPFLMMLKLGLLNNIEWIYFSYEVDRISKEFKFAAFFMAYDYGVYSIEHEGIVYNMCQDYLMHKLVCGKDEVTGKLKYVPVKPEHKAMLKDIYTSRIIPLFGEYDNSGKQIKKGKITFIQDQDNPTGMYKLVWNHAEKNGTFIRETYYITEDGKQVPKTRIIGYKPHNPEKFVITITDHVRKSKRERGFSMKENIDKWLEYTTTIRNLCYYTFINICHSNRSIANVDRLRFAGEWVFPTGDDVKDTGNLSEESTLFITLFNPGDEKYNLEKHMGIELKDYPHYRSIHIVESRYTECPAHIQTNMLGGVNMFTPLIQI